MNKTKQIEVIRKHNAKLTEQLEDLRLKLELNSQLNEKDHQRAKDLICELEKIKQDWQSALEDINDKREKYSALIADLQQIKKIMVGMGFKVPWHQKIKNKFKNV